MYKPLLIFRYLRKRRIAWVSLVAVMLCTAMVLIVLSVMGGWQRMFKESFRALTGDVVVFRGSMQGFEGYEEMAREIKKLPGVEAVTSVVTTPGLVKIGNIEDYVQVMGLLTETPAGSNLDPVDRVMRFRDSLGRQFKELPDKSTAKENASFALLPDVPYEMYVSERLAPAARNYPGMIVASGVVGIRRDKDGKTNVPAGLYTARARLTVVPNDSNQPQSEIRLSPQTYWLVDYSRTQAPQHDMKNVYVPIARLQRDLGMQASSDGVDAARITELHIKTRAGVNPLDVRDQAEVIVRDISGEVAGFGALRVETWEQRQSIFLSAIEKERVLITFLFSLISLVAVFLIFCIFYMIVVEKTRDIGIIKSVGATGWGVAQIFLGYGTIIGVVGGGMGLGLGWVIVHNINLIHTLMGKILGVQIWSAETYGFDIIPNRLDTTEALIIYAVAIVSATLGAIIPAVRAAWLNPVEALRFE